MVPPDSCHLFFPYTHITFLHTQKHPQEMELSKAKHKAAVEQYLKVLGMRGLGGRVV